MPFVWRAIVKPAPVGCVVMHVNITENLSRKKHLTPFQEATVLYDCFIRAIGLPQIYPQETVKELIGILEAAKGLNDPEEEHMLEAYLAYLKDID